MFLHQKIELQAARAPLAIAVRCGDESLTYAQLDHRANQCARYLSELGAGPDVVIGLLMDRSLEMVVAMLGILKAGAAYLPLDPTHPASRLELVLEDAGVSVILVQAGRAAALPGFSGTVQELSLGRDMLDRYDGAALQASEQSAHHPDDLAYVIYTSGTTGQPKGCMLSHRAICNRLDWMQAMYGLSDQDRVLQKTPYTFDVSVWEFFWTLREGATLVLARPQGHKDNQYLAALIEREGITVCHFVPSMLRLFLDSARLDQCASLRHVFVSGEALPYESVARFKQSLAARLHNLYGPTEAAVDVTYWECELRPDGMVPIGKAIANIRLHILDESLKPVARGQQGMLYIAGVGLARGYLNRPELTEQCFVPDPFGEPGARLYRTGDYVRELDDGNIVFIGRLDAQVKLRGLRIELGEIEATLRLYPGVQEAAVLVTDQDSGDPKLTAYLVVPGEAPGIGQIREFVRGRLPDYMVPNKIAVLNELPVTAHGKLDRKALTAPSPVQEAAQPASVPVPAALPVSGQEVALSVQARLTSWLGDALGVDTLDVQADLFDLGATSLTLVRLVEWLRQEFDVDVPVEHFLRVPTTAGLVAYLQEHCPRSLSAAPNPPTSPALVYETASDAARPVVALPMPGLRAQAYMPPPAGVFDTGEIELSTFSSWLSLLGARFRDGRECYLHPSGGGLNAVRTYVLVKPQRVADLQAGVYYFQPVTRSLYRVGDALPMHRRAFAQDDVAAFDSAACAVFFVAALDAIVPIYQQHSGVLAAVEAGYMAQLLQGRQTEWGLATRAVEHFDTDFLQQAFDLAQNERFVYGVLAGPSLSPASAGQASTQALANVGPVVSAGQMMLSHRAILDRPASEPLTQAQTDHLKAQRLHLRDVTALPTAIALPACAVDPDDYRLRACRREYEADAVSLQTLAALLCVARPRADAPTAYLYGLSKGQPRFQLYLWARRVQGLEPGAYRYDPQRHVLVKGGDLSDEAMVQSYTPFNRKHFKASAFCLFLVSEPAAPLSDAQAIHGPLLDAGHFGQCLMENQAQFGLGLCPIGGLRFDALRQSLGLAEQAVLLHSFTGGVFLQTVPEHRRRLLDAAVAPVPLVQEAMAIVGQSGRFPGAEAGGQSYWELLSEGRSSITPLSAQRRALLQVSDETHLYHGAFLEQIDCFDSLLFNISPPEARALDPQERLLLETAWACLEEAGYSAQTLRATSPKVGVFVGAMWNDYQSQGVQHWMQHGGVEEFSHHASIANRVSYCFNLTGPSVALNTSCSSGMTALHFACESIRRGECDAALVGGVNLASHAYHLGLLESIDFLSKEGICRPLSAQADGWVLGEGVGMVLIKSESAARRDRDHIHALIRATAIGHSGRTLRFGVPSPEQQEAGIRQALRTAGLQADGIDYVELAAAGAGMADASELSAVQAVFARRQERPAVWLGTVKANVGHLESASVFSQLFKVIHQLQARELAPSLNTQPRSPLIRLAGTGLELVEQRRPWVSAQTGRPLRALINVVGAAGATGHIVLEEYTGQEDDRVLEAHDVLVPLSAATGERLKVLAARLLTALDSGKPYSLADVAWTLQQGRVGLAVRWAAVVRDRAQLMDALQALLAVQETAPLLHANSWRGQVVDNAPDVQADMSLADQARCWVQGGAVDWDALAPAHARRVGLPSYPFEPVSHWIGTKAGPSPALAPSGGPDLLRDKTIAYLLELMARVTEVPAQRLTAWAPLESYGLTSLMIQSLTDGLEQLTQSALPTVFFQVRSVAQLADYLLEHHGPALARHWSPVQNQHPLPSSSTLRAVSSPSSAPAVERAHEDIAIIGLSGRYPQANSIREFWNVLSQGLDCIDEIPAQRWDHHRYFDSERGKPGKTYSKWGGFIEGVDEFDPLFFGMTPSEAVRIDPQERLFLQTAWHTLEDAGYTPESLKAACGDRIGVFVGMMYSEYQLYPSLPGGAGMSGTYGTVANRVSYVLGLRGPSMVVDTLCSSSLTAIHLACASIRAGECSAALAGGVSLSLHPNKYVTHALLGMSASDGRCRSFGEGGDGFVPGEGVGAVLLKPLSQALRDGDQIYGLIKGVALNHGGRTNGFTVPDPLAQADAVRAALAASGLSAHQISYLEAHGTGTALGDPIELAGLEQVFGQEPQRGAYCAIGSVKSNIGHCEAAAGIAGLTKVLLQMRHRTLVKSLHSERLNPKLDFSRGPFAVQTVSAAWDAPSGVRVAGISSFGAGGSNAHLIVQEHAAPEPVGYVVPETGVAIVLSAKTAQALRELAQGLLDCIQSGDLQQARLADAAYTLQVGRETMPLRWACVVATVADLQMFLQDWLAGKQDVPGLYQGHVKPKQAVSARAAADEDMEEMVRNWLLKGKLHHVLDWWVKGLLIDWASLYRAAGTHRPMRMSLPGYPFARERYWVTEPDDGAPTAGVSVGVLHPLVHRNTSDLTQQRYSTDVSPQTLQENGYRLFDQACLTAGAYLEMARDAVLRALGEPSHNAMQLSQLRWGEPSSAPDVVHISVQPPSQGPLLFEIYSDAEQVYCSGFARAVPTPALVPVDLAAWQAQCAAAAQPGTQLYEQAQHRGLVLGAAAQALDSFHKSEGFALGRLLAPPATRPGYGVPPGFLDAACLLALELEDEPGLCLPHALESIEFCAPCPPSAWLLVRRQGGTEQAEYDVTVCDEQGRVAISLQGLSLRPCSLRVDAREQSAVAVTSLADVPVRSPQEMAQLYFKQLLARVFQLPLDRLDADMPFEDYGIDSILITQVTMALEQDFGPLSKTLFFEYQTIEELAAHFLEQHGERMRELSLAHVPTRTQTQTVPTQTLLRRRDPAGRRFAAGAAQPTPSGIAVVGMAGRYPQSWDLDALWDNLRAAKDCITEIPPERWDHSLYFDADRSKSGTTYTKWGGFIDGVEQFDAQFFNISPREAQGLDPQERLFLQCAYAALEDAGYTRETLGRQTGHQVGVYVGVSFEEYKLFGAEWQAHGHHVGLAGTPGSIANRVSYFCNFHGPSMTLDTMCSASMTALHLACESIWHGQCQAAIAGGVNLNIHPNKYLLLAQGKFASSKGRCESFGAGGDGYVPSEGVGALLLKPLEQAVADGDHIYGVIRGSAINHGGKVNGYTVPNPHAQSDVVRRAMDQAGVDPQTVSYLEAHGTGTSLGDPIEIAGLSKVFGTQAGVCAIGSVKSNIGHCEAAAGIAGVTKVLLQLRHGQLVPSLHAQNLNPNIDFAATPFRVQRELSEWKRPRFEHHGQWVEGPRRAGISSFGAGGSNAHVVLEEYVAASQPALAAREPQPMIVMLSARTEPQLQERAQQLLAAILDKGWTDAELVNLAYTLNVGREGMAERLAILAESMGDLVQRLREYLAAEGASSGFVRGQARRGHAADDRREIRLDRPDGTPPDWQQMMSGWVHGQALDWAQLYPGLAPKRMSLPTYPFARQRCWVPRPQGLASGSLVQASGLESPGRVWVQRDAAQATQLLFNSRLSGQEFFLRDHIVQGQRVFPGVAYLEMAWRAQEQAQLFSAQSAGIRLRNIVWSRPLIVQDQAVDVRLALTEAPDGAYVYEVSSGEHTVHSQGRLSSLDAAPEPVDLPSLQSQCQDALVSGEDCYALMASLGFAYGPAFRGIQQIHVGQGQLLARLELTHADAHESADFALSPGLLDSALQSTIALADPRQPSALALPFGVDVVDILGACTSRMWAWVRPSAGQSAQSRVRKQDVTLCDEAGRVVVHLQGFTSRVVEGQVGAASVMLLTPQWDAQAPARADPPTTGMQRYVIAYGLNLDPAVLGVDTDGATYCVVPPDGDANTCFAQAVEHLCQSLQDILRRRPMQATLIQVLVPSTGEYAVLSGLSGVLKTAQQEQPKLIGQVIAAQSEWRTDQWRNCLTENAAQPMDAQVRYSQGQRQVLGWQTLSAPTDVGSPWRDGGVYLITGGLGGLGRIVAQDIARQTSGATLILTGRRALDQTGRAYVRTLEALGASVDYQMLDVADRQAVHRVLQQAQEDHQALNGIVHAAGVLQDSLLLKKTPGDIQSVLAPKVAGIVNLDQASGQMELDFLICFSSISAVMGNLGQADYAAANGFLDCFARQRNEWVRQGLRHGHTLSINWPFWREGGMRMDAASEQRMEQLVGLTALESVAGIQALYQVWAACRAAGGSQAMVLQGAAGRLRQLIDPLLRRDQGVAVPDAAVARPDDSVVLPDVPAPTAMAQAGLDDQCQQGGIQEVLLQAVSDLLKIPYQELDGDAELSEFGFDSVTLTEFGNVLNQRYQIALAPTVFFEHSTLNRFAAYLAAEHAAAFAPVQSRAQSAPSHSVPDAGRVREESPALGAQPSFASHMAGTSGSFSASESESAGRSAPPAALREPVAVHSSGSEPALAGGPEPIAVIGMSACLPMAADLHVFWENLLAGKDCIEEIPAQRWDWRQVFGDPVKDANKTPVKWGGFIQGVDEFDPLFFGISPKEAEAMDPQQRLLMIHIWKAIEDAAYAPSSLSGSRTAIYVGTGSSGYTSLLAQAQANIEGFSAAGIVPSVGPNRMSYLLNLHGPSEPVETACSSALIAVRKGVMALLNGGCEMAIVGGVNTILTPDAHISFSKAGMLSLDGRCKTFSAQANGYARGEGVGILVLKRLSAAQRDGDPIHGLILGTAENHGGRANSLTSPNPQAQAALLQEAYQTAGVDPDSVSYIEAHGTGTALGDPIEINGIKMAFKALSQARGIQAPTQAHCGLGSVKSNIGHLELAAGVAGVLKVLLQFKHKTLVKTLHCDELNPYIDLEHSPFYVVRDTRPWSPPVDGQGRSVPRRAGVSSFGFGGVNAHVVMQEYEAPPLPSGARPQQPALVLLSALDQERLQEQIALLLEAIDRHGWGDEHLESLAYTLQVGREAMEERLAVMADSMSQLQEKLRAVLASEPLPKQVFRGQVRRNKEAMSLFVADQELQEAVRKWAQRGKFAKMLSLWVKGLAFDWNTLYGAERPRRMNLPTYPFARERYWVPETEFAQPSVPADFVAARGGDQSDDFYLDVLDKVVAGDLSVESAVRELGV
ncbi:MAG TPA: amino acid adenylation domain-containing protein [Alcaligenes sp.]|nr:amino acid adenylation domain-containing protein [Alcaligenes sp.]HRL27145.1 amino acid adenylation domain-containing protein [Alcaligenes sp.]